MYCTLGLRDVKVKETKTNSWCNVYIQTNWSWNKSQIDAHCPSKIGEWIHRHSLWFPPVSFAHIKSSPFLIFFFFHAWLASLHNWVSTSGQLELYYYLLCGTSDSYRGVHWTTYQIKMNEVVPQPLRMSIMHLTFWSYLKECESINHWQLLLNYIHAYIVLLFTCTAYID